MVKHTIAFDEDCVIVNGVLYVKTRDALTSVARTETHHIGSEDYHIERSSKTDKAIVDEILRWCKEHHATSGESLCQNDECVIDAPYLISDIIDKYLKIEDGIVEDK